MIRRGEGLKESEIWGIWRDGVGAQWNVNFLASIRMPLVKTPHGGYRVSTGFSYSHARLSVEGMCCISETVTLLRLKSSLRILQGKRKEGFRLLAGTGEQLPPVFCTS